MTHIDDARRQEQRKKAGDLLKMADKLFKSQDYEGAARLVEIAMQTDPKNAYVMAYQERIKHALEQRDQTLIDSKPSSGFPARPVPAQPEPTAMSGRSVQEELKRKIEEAHRRLVEEQERLRQKEATPPPQPEPRPSETRVDLLKQLDEDVSRELTPPRQDYGLIIAQAGSDPEVPVLRREIREIEQPHLKQESVPPEKASTSETVSSRPAHPVQPDIDIAQIRSRIEQEAAREFQKKLEEERHRLTAEIRREVEEGATDRFHEQIANWEAEKARLQQDVNAQLAAERTRAEELTREFQSVGTEIRRKAEETARAAALAEAEQRVQEALARQKADADRVLADLQARHGAELAAVRKEAEVGALRIRQESATEVRRQADQEFSQRLTEELVRLESDIRRRVDEESSRKLQVEQRKLDDERTRLQEDVRRRSEEEVLKLSAARRQLEEAMRGQLTEEMRRTDDHRRAEQAKLDQLRKTLEEDAQRRLEEERQKLMSAVYEERLRISTEKEELETMRRQFEASRQRFHDREFVNSQEEKRQLEEQLRKEMVVELERRVQEERKVLEETRQKDLYEQREARRQETEQLRKEWEEEHRRVLAEELQRERAETQRRKEVELLQRRSEESARYDDAIRQAIEEGRREAQKKKAQSHLETAKAFLARAEFEEALHEITKVLHLDPSYAAARDLEQTIYVARSEHQRRKAAEHQQVDDQVRQYEQVHRRLTTLAREDADQEHVREQRDYIVRNRLQAAERLYVTGEYKKALVEIDAVLTLDPTNPQAKQLELAILSMKGSRKDADAASTRRAHDEEEWRQDEVRRSRLTDGIRENLKRESLLAYSNILRTAWRDGRPSQAEREVLDVARESLKVAPGDHASLEREIQLETYREALQHSLTSGVLTLRDTHLVDALREKYGIQAEDHTAIEVLLRNTPPDRR